MTRTHLRWAIVAAALVVARRAAALDVTGALSIGHDRSEAWAGGEHTVTPAWDYAGQLSLSGQPFAPGILSWMGSGEYRRYRSLYSESTSTTDNINFNGAASLFSSSPLSLQLTTSRSWSDFTSDGAVDTTGSSRVTNYGARARYVAPDRPTVTAAVSRAELDNRSFGVRSQSDTTGLDVGIAQSLNAFDYALQYDTTFNNGTFSDTNYRSHYFTLNASAPIADAAMVRITDHYFLRDPTLVAATNPRYDDNDFSLNVSSMSSTRVVNRGDYQYRHFVTTIPGLPGRDALDHLVGAASEYRYSSAWTFTGNVGAAYAKDRLGTTEIAGSTEQVGGAVRWQSVADRSQYFLSGGGSVGVQQREGDGTRGAWGATAGAGANTARDTWVGGLNYNLSFSSNLSGEFGSTLSQQINASADTRVEAWLLRGLLTLGAGRRYADVGESSVNRTVQATVIATGVRYQLQLSGGLTDGASGTLRNPGDGLFLPASYNTRSRFVLSTAQLPVTSRLTLSVTARYQRSTAPGRSLQWEEGLGATLAYTLGSFVLSVDERLSHGGYAGSSQTGSLLFVRLTRYFGASF